MAGTILVEYNITHIDMDHPRYGIKSYFPLHRVTASHTLQSDLTRKTKHKA